MNNPAAEILNCKKEEEDEEPAEGEREEEEETAQGLPIRVGDEFSSLAELEEAIHLLQEMQNVVFWKRDSRTVQNGQKKVKTRLNPDLKYYEVRWACQRGGRLYESQSTGHRPKQSTIRGECEAFVKVCVTKDGQRLVVKKANFTHNHTTKPMRAANDTDNESIDVPINFVDVTLVENPSQIEPAETSLDPEANSPKEKKRGRKRKQILDPDLCNQEAQGLLKYSCSSQHHPDRHDIFGQYVASEMRRIEDHPLLYLHTKRVIQDALCDAQEKILLSRVGGSSLPR